MIKKKNTECVNLKMSLYFLISSMETLIKMHFTEDVVFLVIFEDARVSFQYSFFISSL